MSSSPWGQRNWTAGARLLAQTREQPADLVVGQRNQSAPMPSLIAEQRGCTPEKEFLLESGPIRCQAALAVVLLLALSRFILNGSMPHPRQQSRKEILFHQHLPAYKASADAGTSIYFLHPAALEISLSSVLSELLTNIRYLFGCVIQEILAPAPAAGSGQRN